MSEGPDKRSAFFGDGEMHRLFRDLREEIGEVAHGFAERVMLRVRAVVAQRHADGPSLDRVVSEVATESAAMLTKTVKDHFDDDLNERPVVAADVAEDKDDGVA